MTVTVVHLEPEFVTDKAGAAMLAISPRTFADLVKKGDITQVKVPGLRRVVYSVADIRALAARWRQPNDDRGLSTPTVDASLDPKMCSRGRR